MTKPSKTDAQVQMSPLCSERGVGTAAAPILSSTAVNTDASPRTPTPKPTPTPPPVEEASLQKGQWVEEKPEWQYLFLSDLRPDSTLFQNTAFVHVPFHISN